MSSIEIFEDKSAMRFWSRSQKRQGKSVALVPTMGFLHSGHLSLIARAKSLADVVAVSIYVNPTQFGPSEDLDRYPSDMQGDLEKLKSLSVSAAFCPKDLYDRAANPHQTWITVKDLEKPLCGAGRPGHFKGVATVVCKLFNIVEPDVAVFGKKDYQQFRVISQMVQDLDMGVTVVGAPLMREPDGLALSSRNVRLTPEEREKALSISRSLFEAKAALRGLSASTTEQLDAGNSAGEVVAGLRDKIMAAGGRLEYAELVDMKTLSPTTDSRAPSVLAVAALFGSVRLIDNIELNAPE